MTFAEFQISEIGELIRGVTFSKTESSKEPKNGMLPVLRSGNVQKQLVTDDKLLFIPENKPKERQMLQRGDIVISVSNSRELVGKSSIASNDWKGTFGAFLTTLRVDKSMADPKYVYYFMQTKKWLNEIARNSSSTNNIANVNNSRLGSLKIKLPSIVEQEKTVSKIEELFSELDDSEKLLRQLKQDQKTYLQSILKKLYTPKKDWKSIKSKELFSYVTSGSRGWAKYYSDNDTHPYFLRVTNVNYETINLDLRPKKLKYVALPDSVEGRRTLVQPGDILISITGYVGMVGVVPNKIREAYISQHISLARPIKDVNPKYLAYYLISKTGGLRQLELLQKGATKAGLTLSDIKNIDVPLAPRKEQDQVVDSIDQVMSELGRLNKDLDNLKTTSSTLRQSILSKAFKGELS